VISVTHVPMNKSKSLTLTALLLAPLVALDAAETNGVAIAVTALGKVISPLLTLNLAGDWRIIVTAKVNLSPVSATLDVAPPDVFVVTNKKHDKLRDFNPNGYGWGKGSLLNEIRACESAVKGALDPASLVVRDGADATATTFEKGKDFDADLEWGAVGRLPGGRIQADQQVFISYKYAKRRIDSVVLPELMPGFTKQRDIDNDPRPYVAGLRTFAEKNKVALFPYRDK